MKNEINIHLAEKLFLAIETERGKKKRKKGGMLMESNFYNHFQNIERVFPLEFVASHRRQIYIDLMC